MQGIISVHITHKRADIGLMERIGAKDTEALLSMVAKVQGVSECVVLRTCNRVEAYIITQDPEATRRGIEVLINGRIPFGSSEELVQYLSGQDTLRHLLRVTCGLESMVIGEDQIQMQVREAFELAEREGHVGAVLSIIFRKAISVGKRVRTETNVNKGGVSIGSAAVELAESILGDLRGKNILVLGAGEMATLIARHLVDKGPKAVFISNRTYSRAVELAWALDGKAVRFDSLPEYLALSDVVLCATSATHNILEKRHIEAGMARRGERRMFIIDVSFPRNVDPRVREVEGVELFDIDGLREMAGRSISRRKGEIVEAERIIGQELELLTRKLEEQRANGTIKGLFGKFMQIKEREVRKAINRVHAGEDPDTVFDEFADVLISRFLADPTDVLKRACLNGQGALMESAKDLFRINGDQYVPPNEDEKVEDGARRAVDGAGDQGVGTGPGLSHVRQ